jgi:2-oxoglutarate ferredoxin oxidoreductase subunit beta
VFGLTTGQFTPTSPLGYKGRSTPKGAPENPINPIELMLAAGATFVARVYPVRMKHMIKVVKEAIKHRGFSLVDVLQPCVVWYNTYKYYSDNVYLLEEEDHDPTDFEAALRKSRLWTYGFDGKVPIGVFYKVDRPTFEEMLLKGRKPKELPYVGSIRHVLQQHI